MRQSGTPLLRTARSVAMIAVLVTAAACGGGGSGGGGVTPPGGPIASFVPSGTASTPELVRLGNAVPMAGGLIEIQVILDGAVSNRDVFSFAFDVIMSNPAIVDFISVEAGTALSPGNFVAFGAEGLN